MVGEMRRDSGDGREREDLMSNEKKEGATVAAAPNGSVSRAPRTNEEHMSEPPDIVHDYMSGKGPGISNVSFVLGGKTIPLRVNGNKTEHVVGHTEMNDAVSVTDELMQFFDAVDRDANDPTNPNRVVNPSYFKQLQKKMVDKASDALNIALPLINERPASYWLFPYTDRSDLFNGGCTWLLVSGGWLSEAPETEERANAETGGMFSEYCAAVGRVHADFAAAIEAMRDGRISGDWKRLKDGSINMLSLAEHFDVIDISLEEDGIRITPLEAIMDGLIDFNTTEDQYAALCILCKLGHADELRAVLPTREKKPAEKVKAEIIDTVPDILMVMSAAPTAIADQCLTWLTTNRKPRRDASSHLIIENMTKADKVEAVFTIRDARSGKTNLKIAIRNYQGLTSQDKNGTVNKVYHYLLNVIFEQRFAQPCVFRTENLVRLGIYKNVESARKNLPTVLSKISAMEVSGDYFGASAKKTVSSGTRLITEYAVTRQTVTVFPSQMPNAIDFFGGSFAQVPNFVWGLSKHAHMLAYEIFMRARQETSKVSAGEAFTVTVKNIADKLGLPTIEEVQFKHNRKYAEKITDPIDKAIAEIREAASKEEGSTIEIEAVNMYDAANIEDYLANGRIRVTIRGSWADRYKEIQKRAADAMKRIRGKKETEIAKRLAGTSLGN